MTTTEVNPAVAMILPGARFERSEAGHLYLINPSDRYSPRLRWRLRSDRLWPHDRRSATFTGGTVVQALTQLSLWLNNWPRRPLRCWQAWCHHGLGDGRGPRLLEYLGHGSYPAWTGCIHCGAPDATDWWSLDGATGPCCRHRACRG